jgi:hypothetical protein
MFIALIYLSRHVASWNKNGDLDMFATKSNRDPMMSQYAVVIIDEIRYTLNQLTLAIIINHCTSTPKSPRVRFEAKSFDSNFDSNVNNTHEYINTITTTQKNNPSANTFPRLRAGSVSVK